MEVLWTQDNDKVKCLIKCQMFEVVGGVFLPTDGEFYDVVQCSCCGRVWLQAYNRVIVVEGVIRND